MNPVQVVPDAERMAVDLLTGLLEGKNITATVGVTVPTTWKTGDTPHVQVGWDGTDDSLHPVMSRPLIRVTAWSHTPTQAKNLARACHALLLSQPEIREALGIFPTQDRETRAQLASFVIRATWRTQSLT